MPCLIVQCVFSVRRVWPLCGGAHQRELWHGALGGGKRGGSSLNPARAAEGGARPP